MFQYLSFYKPFEVLSQFTDSKGRKTLKDYIPISDIYPAGRLDYRSEGLLLLTDDGKLIQKLTDPRFEHIKTYLVQVEGIISDQSIQILNSNIVLPGLQSRLPSVSKLDVPPQIQPRIKPVRDYHPTSWLKIELSEGKKHQVRRMTAAVGFPTLRLIRIAIGDLDIENLKPGDWRPLSNAEVQKLFTLKGKQIRQTD